MSYQTLCASLARRYVIVSMYLTLLVSPPRLSWLTTILRLGWLAWLVGAATIVIFSVVIEIYEKVGFMLGHVRLVLNILTSVATIIEVMLKDKHRRKLLRLEREVDELLQKQVDISGMEFKVNLQAFRHIVLQTVYDIIQLTVAITSYRSPAFFYTVPLMVVQRTRYIQVILTIQRHTVRSSCMIDALQLLVRANRPKFKYTSDVWQPYTLWEYERLISLRLIQGRTYELHKSVSKCYGWSIIVLVLTTFFTLVSNIFWCISMLSHDFQLGKLIYSMMTMFRSGTLVVMLLVIGDRARRNNSQISGLIYKLSKPFGNETYNDLVSNFSLQCLDEGLTINVKGFVTLDLTFLKHMIALTVTYLIILIQFMGSGRKTLQVGLNNTFSVNETSEKFSV